MSTSRSQAAICERSPQPNPFRVSARPRELCGGLRIENLIVLGQRDPGLFAAGPEMHGRSQPRGIVQRAGPHAAQAIIRTRLDFAGKAAGSRGCSRERTYSPSKRLASLLPARIIHFAENRHKVRHLSRNTGPSEDRTVREPGGGRRDVRSVRSKKASQSHPLAAESRLATELSKRRRGDGWARRDWFYSVRAAPRRGG